MSLIVLRGDELIADRCCVLVPPHAAGQTVMTEKIRVAKDKTFAYASVGPTLTETEKGILEEIITLTFRMARGESSEMDFEMQDWFKHRTSLDILVMTKTSSYFSHFVGGKYDENEMFRPRGANRVNHSLIQFDASIPAVYGTGAYLAFIAAAEGLPMKDVVPLVADLEYTVTKEYSIVHRKQLKRMTFK